MIRAVIVDWAGTIVDFGSIAPVETFIRVFARNGVEITTAEARAPMGQGKRDHIQSIAAAVEERWADAHGGRGPTAADIDKMYAEFIPLQIEAVVGHAAAIPGAVEALATLRGRGLKIGSTTGYSREIIAPLEVRARAQGLILDCVVCASDVSEGRPGPAMALEAARRLAVAPMHAVVKIGDTVADIGEGRNAGMWSVGVAATGNEVGLDEEAFGALPREERERRIGLARDRLLEAGAHAVIDSIAEAPALVDALLARLANGERP
jgi:phosphonoacetaldehyde hydrolase